MPVINTVKSALKGFSDQKAVAICTHGRDTLTKPVNGCVMTWAILEYFTLTHMFAWTLEGVHGCIFYSLHRETF
jgi:hypothetical protein